ncbi:MAG: 30S ribosome-binding factor RbfA [Planctomycetota bacterium]
MSAKRERLVSSIERGIQQVLARGLQDPRIRGLITITRVEITPDGKFADVGISVLPEEHQELTLHGLRSARRHVRREVGELIRTRAMPELRFRLDTSLKKQAEVLDALAQVREEDDPNTPEADDAEAVDVEARDATEPRP